LFEAECLDKENPGSHQIGYGQSDVVHTFGTGAGVGKGCGHVLTPLKVCECDEATSLDLE
jgi:hypothetical protein